MLRRLEKLPLDGACAEAPANACGDCGPGLSRCVEGVCDDFNTLYADFATADPALKRSLAARAAFRQVAVLVLGCLHAVPAIPQQPEGITATV